jgi:hypothetical protein
VFAAEARGYRTLVDAFARVGIQGVFPATAEVVARAEGLAQQVRDQQAAVTARRREAVDRLIEGGPLAAVDAAALNDGVAGLVKDAERRLGRLAADAAMREASGAYAALERLVGSAVAEAVEAGRQVVDVPRLARLVFDVESRGMMLPGVLEGADRRPGWPVAAAATDRVDALMRVAEMLGGVTGESYRVLGRPGPGGADWIVGEYVPRPLHLAIVDELGWRPGLVAEGGVVSPEDRKADRDAATSSALRLAPLRGALRRAISVSG